MDAKVIRQLKPEQYDVAQLVQLGGLSFSFRASQCNGGIRVEFDTDLSLVKARIGKLQRPGRPRLRRKD